MDDFVMIVPEQTFESCGLCFRLRQMYFGVGSVGNRVSGAETAELLWGQLRWTTLAT